MKRTALKRRTPLRPTLLQRHRWMKRVSDRRKAERKVYLEMRTRFLKEHPLCQIGVAHAVTPGGSQRRSRHVHHVKGRGPHLLDESTWLATCRACHDWVHSNANEARALGWLQF
jgi:hypothetical protein